jgi:hypothetical protein
MRLVNGSLRAASPHKSSIPALASDAEDSAEAAVRDSKLQALNGRNIGYTWFTCT